MSFRIGQGADFHRLETGHDLWLGGVKIPFDKGCVAHSDGDVLLHAICDALLGAAGLSDIGHQYPDTDEKYRKIDSKILLSQTFRLIKESGFDVVNIDCTVCLESPKIAPHIPGMKRIISSILAISAGDIAVKATTTEKMGFIGKGEGIAAMAVALLSAE